MTGTGGALFPAFTTTAPTDVAPGPSVTRSRTVTVFVCVYVKEGCAAVESPNVPSPFRSQEYVSAPPSGSEELRPSKFTVSGIGPLCGFASAIAVGGLVACEVADPADRALVEAGVEEVASGPDLEVHGAGRAGVEGGDARGIGQAVRARLHDPDAAARVVGEEERAVVGGG